MHGQGTFDAATQTYTWSAAGLLGTRAWLQSGEAQWSRNPAEALLFDDPPPDLKLKGKLYWGDELMGDMEGSVTANGGTSSGAATLIFPAGDSRIFTITDEVPPDLKGPWKVKVNGLDDELTLVTYSADIDSSDSGIIEGISTVRVVAVPEPATWLMVCSGMLVLAVGRKTPGRFPLRYR